MNLSSRRFWHSGGPQRENKRKRRDKQILRPCQRAKKKQQKTVEHEGDSDTNWMILKNSGRMGNQRKNQDNPDHCQLNCVLMLNWIVWNSTIFIKMDLALSNLQRYAIKPKQTTNQAIPFLRSLRILRRVLETCCHSDSMERPQALAGVKKLDERKMICRQMVYALIKICTENNTLKIFRDSQIQTGNPIPVTIPKIVLIDKKKRSWHLKEFAVPVDHRVKMKESEKIDKYLDLARELKKLLNMNVTVISVVTGARGTIRKRWEEESSPPRPQNSENQQDYWEESWTWKDLLSSRQ